MSAGPGKLCKLLNCKYPLIQAPMLGSVDETLALAVAKAGAVGSIPCSGLSHAALDELLARHRREVPELALTYNFFCHKMPSSGQPQAVSREWLAALAPFYSKEGLHVTEEGLALSLATKATPTFSQEHVDILLRHKPRAVSFHFGLPPLPLWRQIKDSGMVTMASATTVEEAKVLASSGGAVDVVVAQGQEAGGHRGIFLAEPPLRGLSGQLATADLVSGILREWGARQTTAAPVLVAAGGIGDARGVQAALHLGADGVQVGTAFLLCDEAVTHPAHRAALERARRTGEKPHITNVLSGRPAQGLCNAVMRELGVVNEAAPPFPFGQNYMEPLKKANHARYGSLWCGQNLDGLLAIPAADQVRRLMTAPTP